ncbi:EAL domain-containing protein [Thiospirillum jenense]|uniref:EAL domain-containing protein n=1 Tax=Thiospirillum jenense TaxID=1653858 RepID=A0A839HJK8_9GAMM|nr:EAL domain-containing protein [Thiospirillum jenense]MBB1127126.1 EAL domain-containing protein [Thiospirillum jenense]
MSNTTTLTVLILAAQAARAEELFATLRQAQLPVRGSFTQQPHKLVRAHHCDLVIAALATELPATAITEHYVNLGRDLPMVVVCDGTQDPSAVLTLLSAGSSTLVHAGDEAALIRAVRREWKLRAMAGQIEQLRARLKLSEHEIHELIGQSTTPTARVRDTNGQHLDANAAYRSLFGIPEGTALESTALLDLVAPEYRDAMRSLIDNNEARGRAPELDSASAAVSQTQTATFTATDGRSFAAQVQATPDVQEEVTCLQVRPLESVIPATVAPAPHIETSPAVSALAAQLIVPPPPETVDSALIAQIERALASDGFKLVFQPIVSLHGDSQELYSVLLRLLDDNHAFRVADDVLESAAQAGQLPEVDYWAIRKALAVLNVRRQLGQRAHFFLSLSAAALADDQFLIWLCDQLREHGVRGSWLSFQINESAARAMPELTEQLALGLKQIKSRLVLAQFGLNPDSELLLTNHTIDLVKFAPSLTQDLIADSFKPGRLRHLVQSAKHAGARTIAVGVEDETSLGFIWTAGVAYVQGHLLGRPSSVFDIGD